MADVIDATVDISVQIILDFIVAIVPDVDLRHGGLIILPLMSEDNESTTDRSGLEETVELRERVIGHFNFPFDEAKPPNRKYKRLCNFNLAKIF